MNRHQHHHGHWHQSATERPGASTSEIAGWVSGTLPADLYAGPPTVTVDEDEILVVGPLAAPEVPAGLDADGVAEAERARIRAFREETRDARIGVAQQSEARFGRVISWGATVGGTTELFTTVHARVGTRLGMPQRQALDALVAGGLAANRAEALAWCVKLFEQNQEAWLAQLREALDSVQAAAATAPPVGQA
jgi:hypothetical protein